MESEVKETNKNKSNFFVKIMLIVAAFGSVICITYFLCLFVVGMLIVTVILAVIYGVCHTFLEFFRILKTKRKSDG